jgi:pheromone shutdown-related protein TraB
MDVGVEPGAEMKAAIAETEGRGIELALIDRDIRVTLHRFWASMSIIEKLKMFYALAGSVIVADDASEMIDIEQLKKEDFVTVAMDEFHKFSPRGAYALITERDAYMSYHLINLAQNHDRVLAVVGAGHRKGMQEFLSDPKTLPPMSELVATIKTYPWGKIIAVAMMAMFAIIIIAIIFSGVGTTVLLWALFYWVIIHGVPTAICTLLARGHPLSALTGFLVSPISALHPLIAAGWFSAIVEAKIRKPKPSDLKKIFAAESFTEMNQIPLFRVVLVAALANVGSSIGTFAYLIFIFPILGIDPGALLSTGFENLIHSITNLFA